LRRRRADFELVGELTEDLLLAVSTPSSP